MGKIKQPQTKKGKVPPSATLVKIFCSLPWTEVSAYKGLGWDRVPEGSMKYRLPAKLSTDHLYHIKVSRGGRLWGYRQNDVFELVWLDPLHQVTPE